MQRIDWKFFPFLIFVLLSIFLFRGLLLEPHKLPSAQIGKELPGFNLPLLDDPTIMANATQFKNKIVVLNIWASWCKTCIDEQVFLMQLARAGFNLYGLNYKDRREDALKWLGEWGNPYQMIISDDSGRLALDLGVYGTPETFIIDQAGKIRYRHVGALSQELWDKEMLPLIQNLSQRAKEQV